MEAQPSRCTAMSKQSGEQCKRRPSKGSTVCAMHGGKAPQVRNAAKQRTVRAEAMVQAERMVARAGVDRDPIEHLLDSLHLATQLVHVWGAMVAAIDDAAERELEPGQIRGELGYEETQGEFGSSVIVMPKDRMLAVNSKGEARVHPYVTEYQQALERRAKFAKLCIDAGIAELQIRIMEQQVELAVRAFEAMLDKLGLDHAKRQEARREYGRHLRLVAG
jgi:hypothetical protein